MYNIIRMQFFQSLGYLDNQLLQFAFYVLIKEVLVMDHVYLDVIGGNLLNSE